MKQKELNVVFLMWVPYGIEYLRSFTDSYKKYPAGVDHDLIILFNGYSKDEDLLEYEQFLDTVGIQCSFLKIENGQDIFAYKWCAEQLTSTYILFFNTYSQILNSQWGKFYLDAISKENVGCVGATGSWQSRANYGIKRVKWIFSKKEKIIKNIPYYVEKELNLSIFSITLTPRMALLASFLKSLKDIFYFPFYPNPHLRTNAFIINRVFWLNLKFNSLKNKKDAYLMESGKNSFTRQILRMHKKVLVMNKFGEVYEPKDWNISKTLWSSDQENLLVNDNFTMLYSIQDESTRNPMTKFLWDN